MIEGEYAKAIYELALETKKENEFSEYFQTLLDALKNEDLYKVLTSPFTEPKEKKKLVSKIFASFDETFLHFVYVLIDHNRISLIQDIYDVFNKLLLEYMDIVKIQIFSAVKLNSMQMIHITEALQKKYEGKKIELENIIDSELIGGIKIVSGGESIDMSLKNSLLNLKESL